MTSKDHRTVIHAKADIHMMEMEAPIFVAGKTGKAVRQNMGVGLRWGIHPPNPLEKVGSFRQALAETNLPHQL